MSPLTTWVIIGAIAAGSFALRAVFLLLPLFRTEMPARVREALDLVPAAAFAALVAPAIMLDNGGLLLWGPAPIAGAMAVGVALRWNNLALTIAVGVVSYAALNLVFF